MLGVLCMLAPATALTLQHTAARMLGWPKTAAIAPSDAVSVLLGVIGALALGFCVILYRAIITNDVEFAVATAYYHAIVAALGSYLLFVGGPPAKLLIPFVVHDAFAAALLFAAVPNSSPLWGVLSKMHLA